ncbi:MAG: alpha/beta fold hydrolase [Chloroflexota bacterium]
MHDLFVKLELTTVCGKMSGDPADPLLLGIHGWSQRNGWHTWEPLMAPLADAGFCVVSVDMPGWGDSPALDNLPLGGSRAVQVVVDILDGLQKEKAVLMGKSWGGGVAVKTAVSYPERISKLVLTAPALRNFDQLSQINQPVLLTWAEDDPVIPVAMSSEFIARVKVIEYISYPTGGHSAAMKIAEDFAPHLIDFLNKD